MHRPTTKSRTLFATLLVSLSTHVSIFYNINKVSRDIIGQCLMNVILVQFITTIKYRSIVIAFILFFLVVVQTNSFICVLLLCCSSMVVRNHLVENNFIQT